MLLHGPKMFNIFGIYTKFVLVHIYISIGSRDYFSRPTMGASRQNGWPYTYTITGHKYLHCSLFVKETLRSRPKPESLGYLAGKNPNYTRSSKSSMEFRKGKLLFEIVVCRCPNSK